MKKPFAHVLHDIAVIGHGLRHKEWARTVKLRNLYLYQDIPDLNTNFPFEDIKKQNDGYEYFREDRYREERYKPKYLGQCMLPLALYIEIYNRKKQKQKKKDEPIIQEILSDNEERNRRRLLYFKSLPFWTRICSSPEITRIHSITIDSRVIYRSGLYRPHDMVNCSHYTDKIRVHYV